MLCRKVERDYIEENYQAVFNRDFDYTFLPYCFRHVGFQPCPLLQTLLNGQINFILKKWKQ